MHMDDFGKEASDGGEVTSILEQSVAGCVNGEHTAGSSNGRRWGAGGCALGESKPFSPRMRMHSLYEEKLTASSDDDA